MYSGVHYALIICCQKVLEVEPVTANPIKHDSCTFPLDQHASYGVDVEEKIVELALSCGGHIIIYVSGCDIYRYTRHICK